jgi:hypothetical protein
MKVAFASPMSDACLSAMSHLPAANAWGVRFSAYFWFSSSFLEYFVPCSVICSASPFFVI